MSGQKIDGTDVLISDAIKLAKQWYVREYKDGWPINMSKVIYSVIKDHYSIDVEGKTIFDLIPLYRKEWINLKYRYNDVVNNFDWLIKQYEV